MVGIVGSIGTALGLTTNKVWKLTSLDNEDNKFIGQFVPEDVTENLGQSQQETTGVGQQQPLIQFGSGETETVSFRARLFKASALEGTFSDALSNPLGTAFDVASGKEKEEGTVKQQIEKLKNFSRKNELIGRPERFILQIGTEMEFEVFVKSPGGISYDEIRADGTIKGASLNMSFVKIKPENLNQKPGVSTAASIKAVAGIITSIAGGISAISSSRRDKLIDIPFGSLHTIDKFLTTKQSDTFEGIAAREYGNAQLGVILRRAQPTKLDFAPGDEVVTIKKNEIVQMPIEATAVALRDNVEGKAILDAYLDLRGAPTSAIV